MSFTSTFLFTFNLGGTTVNAALIVHLLMHQVTAPKAQKVLFVQSVLDALVCASAACGVIQTAFDFYPITNAFRPLDLLLCNFWHSGVGMYFFFELSLSNMILQACDRAVCILSPIRYRLLSRGWYILGGIVYVSVGIATSIPHIIVEMIRDGQCKICLYVEYFATHEDEQKIQNHKATVTLFALPLVSLTGIYGVILWKLRGGRWQSRLVTRASVRFTKLTFYTAVVFLATQTYPALSVYLSSDESYDYESLVGNLGATLTAANSAANPFIFFGDSIVRRLRRRRKGGKSDQSGNEN